MHEQHSTRKLSKAVRTMREDYRDLQLPGEVEVRPGSLCRITISELSESGCRIAEPLQQIEAGKLVLVWLNAIGPLRARVSPAALMTLEFDGAIHPAIVEHFLAC